jgi:hypothetical protein
MDMVALANQLCGISPKPLSEQMLEDKLELQSLSDYNDGIDEMFLKTREEVELPSATVINTKSGD